MAIERIVEITLIVLPMIIFGGLVANYKKIKGKIPQDTTGATLIYHSFEGVTACALFLSVAFDPELIIQIGEFRAMLAALAARAAWGACSTVIAELT